MPDTEPPGGQAGLSDIAEVERETGLPRATVRIWERRYGFPAPLRDERGERRYPPQQLDQLRHMRRLVDQGHRPAQLLADGAALLKRLMAEAASTPVAAAPSRGAAAVLRLLRAHDAAAVRNALASLLAQHGLAAFAMREGPQLTTAVGDAWHAGQLEVHEEHLFSDCLQDVLRPAIARCADGARPEAPVVVLTTFAQEPHTLGLLMAQALFAVQGCPTISLGPQLPLGQIEAAARAHRADLVALSFSASMNPGHTIRGLQELRGMLPGAVRIWAGGSAAALRRRSVAGVRVVQDLAAIPAMLAEDFMLAPREAGAYAAQ